MSAVDHYAAMVARLLEQYKGLPNLDKDLQNAGVELNELEAAGQSVMSDVALAVAYGATLDRWGVLLNTPRFGLSDTDYRGLLMARICQYSSQATPEDIIKFCRLLFGSDKIVYSEPWYPAKFLVEVLDPAPVTPIAFLKEAIRNVKAAGVLPYIQFEPTPVFTFLEDPDTLNTGGFFEEDPLEPHGYPGGYFSYFLTP